MKPSLYSGKRDPKMKLLKKAFIKVSSKKAKKIYSRNNIKNINMMVFSIKSIFTCAFFDYELSKVIDELNRDKKLRDFFEIDGKVPTSAQVYEYLSRYSVKQFENIVNSILRTYYKPRKYAKNTFIVDATPVACDINHIAKYITKEKLEKLDLKWGYSTTKGHFIGFKVTIVLDKKSLTPISILIHPGAPHDSQLFEEILEELQRRRLIKNGTKILFDRGYYKYENYIIGITRFKIIPIIFPHSTFDIVKLMDKMSLPLNVFNETKKRETIINMYKSLASALFKNLKNWKSLKPIRGIIEDFFKVSKKAFGLGKFHNYTTKSISKKIYLVLLLTTIIIQTGFKSKTKMQQLAEGNVELLSPRKDYSEKKKKTSEKQEISNVPEKTEQTTLAIIEKERQTTLEKF